MTTGLMQHSPRSAATASQTIPRRCGSLAIEMRRCWCWEWSRPRTGLRRGRCDTPPASFPVWSGHLLHSLQRAGLVERERRHGGAVWFATPQGTRLGVVPCVTRLLAAIKPLHRGSAAAWSVGRFRNVGTTHGPPIFSPAYKLASVEDPEALGEVIATGAQDDRAYALTKLIALQDPASTRILCEVARGRGAEEPLARQAAVALGSFRTPASIETLIEIAGQRDSIMREAAARSLGRLRAADAVPVLSQLLSFPSEPVRLAAARALGQIGQVASAPALARACADPDRHVRHAARQSLVQLGAAEELRSNAARVRPLRWLDARRARLSQA
jgi:hypothetical protein